MGTELGVVGITGVKEASSCRSSSLSSRGEGHIVKGLRLEQCVGRPRAGEEGALGGKSDR